jgi:PAS domain S-box-containing protein
MLDGFAYCKMFFEDGKPQDFIYLDVNDAFERLTGLKNVVGKKVSEVIPGIRESHPELLEIYGRVALTGNPEKAEIYLDSLGIWLTLSVYSSEREYFITVFDNITERKLSGKALMESEGQKQAILDGIRSNIAFVNEDMKILWANKTAADSVGKLRSQMIGKKCHSLWADSDKPCEGCPTIKAFKTKKSEQITMVTPDGRVWEEKGEPVFDAQGGLIGVVEIALDITERVRAEEERESLRSQLLQAQKMEAIGTLAGGVAHDFNNLLQIALGYSEILLNDKSPDHPDYRNLHTINTSARRGADLVQRLMVFSRKGDTKPRALNLNHEVTQVKKLLDRTIPKMITIELSLESWLPIINADPVQVEQILLNLAINAKDAMPESGGKLTIETRNVTLDEEYCRVYLQAKPGHYVMLSVSDTGHGMTQETVQHIFEPFFTTKGVGKGTGLGLAMVYGIMKHHEGFINCYSEIGHGTTFRIYFPVVSTELVEDSEQEGAVPIGGSETVLLVDDEEFLCDMGSQLLTRAGYTVLTATNGREALDLYGNQRSDISLVILDLIMPEMGGKECFQELVNINPQVKVILSSGFLSDGTTEEARVFGVKGLVEKPYNMRQLLQLVREVLDGE